MPKQTFLNLPPAKRHRLVQNAIDEFATYPYAQASLSRLVVKTGIAKGSIYQYFHHKLDLYTWLLTDELPRLKQAGAGAPAEPELGFFDSLLALYLPGVQFMVQSPRLWRLGFRILETPPDAKVAQVHREIRQLGYDSMHGQLVEAQKSGEIRADLDLPLATHLTLQILGPGLTESILAAHDLDLQRLTEAPETAERIDGQRLESLTRNAIDFLKQAMT